MKLTKPRTPSPQALSLVSIDEAAAWSGLNYSWTFGCKGLGQRCGPTLESPVRYFVVGCRVWSKVIPKAEQDVFQNIIQTTQLTCGCVGKLDFTT